MNQFFSRQKLRNLQWTDKWMDFFTHIYSGKIWLLYWLFIYTSYLDWSFVPKRLMPFLRFSWRSFLNCFASSSNFANFLKAAISSSVSFPFSQKSHKHAEKHFLLKFSCRSSFPVIEIPSPVTLPFYFLSCKLMKIFIGIKIVTSLALYKKQKLIILEFTRESQKSQKETVVIPPKNIDCFHNFWPCL